MLHSKFQIRQRNSDFCASSVSAMYNELGPPGDPGQRERALRSVFIANIAFETTEDELKGVLSQVGPIIHFRMVYDPNTGKPKGFAFCEYQDTETAQSAIRNLHDKSLNGRPLKFDSAANAPDDRHGRGPPPPPMRGPIEPPLYGNPVPPQSAPEEITKAVASLPPEQMFELMKQMQLCIRNNPEEARQLLLQNPQLAYALLQAQVIMRLVDPKEAQELLHRGGAGGGLPVRMDSGPPPPPPTHRQPPIVQPRDPRVEVPPPPPPTQIQSPIVPAAPAQPQGPVAPLIQAPEVGETDEQEQLIKQVLSLTDEQVRLLPEDQRESIMLLREQLKRV